MGSKISKSQFRAHAYEIFRRIETTGDAVIVTDHGTPSVIVRRYVAEARDVRRKLKGSVLRYDRPFEPAGVEGWDSVDRFRCRAGKPVDGCHLAERAKPAVYKVLLRK